MSSRDKQPATHRILVGFVCLVAGVAATQARSAERRTIGLTAGGEPIEALVVTATAADAPSVLVVGGLAGRDASSRNVTGAVEAYEARDTRPFRLLAIPVANPTGAALEFPPRGAAYRDSTESYVLWRWIGLAAPDLALIVGEDRPGLTETLADETVAGVGRIPTRRVAADPLAAVPTELPASPAAREMERRLARAPLALAESLADRYGQQFDRPIYIPGMALIAHIHLGNVEHAQHLAAPYADGRRNSFDEPERRFGLSLYLAGHLVFAELARVTGDERYLRLVRAAADRAFTEDGAMREAMPEHGEMSDALFMGTAILTAAGRLTGERRYFDMAARHTAHMNTLVLRPDGLYRHSPLTDAAWGRGNAFPALGYALALSDFPAEHPSREQLLEEYRQLMRTLADHQNADGAWRQVVDVPGAYSETSSTAMIGFSMLRGIRRGWLDAADFQPHVDAAWRAVLTRTDRDGGFIDVSESTNKQPNLRAYLDREALVGPDPRTGGMVMLFAVERAEADSR